MKISVVLTSVTTSTSGLSRACMNYCRGMSSAAGRFGHGGSRMRKIIQLESFRSLGDAELLALCDDGSI